MAQVIKLKRSAVVGKTPVTSSLELGELAVNTADGKIYLHRSGSSDDTIQSVLTTDATITGSLKLSGSQHISGSVEVMDNINFEGDISGSLGSTSSFDRVISLNTASIGYLIATGSNFATFDTETGSFASGSDLHAILAESASYVTSISTGSLNVMLAESASYLFNASTASLGKLTLASDITGSITSTASFGSINLGDGSQIYFGSDNDGNIKHTGTNLQILETAGNIQMINYANDKDIVLSTDDGSGGTTAYLTLDGSVTKTIASVDISGSITTTGSFGKILGDGGDLTNVADPAAISGSYLGMLSASHDLTLGLGASGSITSTASFGKILGDGGDLTNVADPAAISGSFQGGGSNTISGSLISTGSFGNLKLADYGGLPFASGSDLHQFLAESASYVVSTGTGSYASGSDVQVILAESASYVVSTNTGSFLQNADSASLQTVDIQTLGIHNTLFVSGNITTSGSVIAREFKTEFVSSSIQYASGSNKLGDTLDDVHRFTGSIEATGSKLTIDSVGGVSGSITSTASFGKILGDGSDLDNLPESFTAADISGSYLGLLSGSNDLTLGLGVSGSLTSTGSFGKLLGDGSDLSNLPESFTSAVISGSYLGLLSGSNDLTLGLGVSGSLLSTGSFGNLKLVNYGGLPFASGSDLHQFLAESASYVTSISTGSLNVMLAESASYVTSISTGSLNVVLAESASYVVSTNTGSFLQNADTASLGKVTLTSDITGSLTSTSSIGLAIASRVFVKDTTGMYTDKIRRYSDSDNTTKILLNDEVLKFHAGHSSNESFRISGGASGIISGSITSTGSFGHLRVGDSNVPNVVRVSANRAMFGYDGANAIVQGGASKGIKFNTNTDTFAGSPKMTIAAGGDISFTNNLSGSITSTGSFGSLVSPGLSTLGIVSATSLDADGGVTIDDITIDGTEIDLSSGDLTVDVAGDIDLDAGGQQIKFSSAGTAVGQIDMAGTDLEIKSLVSNATFTLRGNDGGSEIDMLAFDVAGGGKATFLSDVTPGGDVSGSLGKTGSFDRLEGVTLNASISPFASGSDVSQIQAKTGSYATGSDLHQFLAESASYLFNASTASMGATTINSTLFVQGDISTSGSVTAQEFHTEVVSSSVIYESGSTTFGDTIDDVHNRTGSLYVSGNIVIPDVAKIQAGTGGDLEIYHDGTNSVINNTTGDLQIYNNADDGDVKILTDDGSGGTTTYMSFDGGSTITTVHKNMRFDDSVKLVLGGGSDLQLYHDGSNSYIDNIATGHLYIRNTLDDSDIIFQSDNNSGGLTNYIQLDGSEMETVFNQKIKIEDSKKLFIGSGRDLEIYHDGSHHYFDTNNGNFYFRDDADNNLFAIAREGGGIYIHEGDITFGGKLHFDNSDSGNTYVSESAADVLDFTVGGVRMLRLDEGNKKSIVTASLDISGSVTASGTSAGTYKEYSPYAQGMIIERSTGGNKSIEYKNTGNSWYAGITSIGTFAISENGDIASGREFHMSGSGKVGLGTARPSASLHIFESDGLLGATPETSAQDLIIESDGNAGISIISGKGSIERGSLVFGHDDDSFAAGLVYNAYGDQLSLQTQQASNTIRIATGNNDESFIFSGYNISGSITSTGSFGALSIGGGSGKPLTVKGPSGDIARFQHNGSVGAVDVYSGTDGGLINVRSGSGTSTINIDARNDKINLIDNISLTLGTSNDLQIYHDGSNTYMANYTGNLILEQQLADGDIIFNSDDGSGGAANYMIIDGGSEIITVHKIMRFDDSIDLRLGAGSDLRLYHNGTNSYVENYTGDLYIRNNTDDGDIHIQVDDGGSNTITAIQIDASAVGNVLLPNDNQYLKIGASNDFSVYHNGTNSYIANDTGHLYLSVNADDKNIVMRTDDGSGGVANYMILDGGSSIITVHKNMRLDDDIELRVGAGSDLRIVHNGSNSFIDSYTGALYLRAQADNEDIILQADDGSGGMTSYLTLDGSAETIEVAKKMQFPASHATDKIVMYSGGNEKIGTAAHTLVMTAASHSFVGTNGTTKVSIGSQGETKVSGSILPTGDNKYDLGSAALRWDDVFAAQTTIGALFETGLRSKGIGKEETGTIVVWRNGGLVPCDTDEDVMVMGVVKEGKDEPIVMGAEPVLVTGDVKEGDFITTSTKSGHGKKLENGYLLKKDMFGKVIAQALEDSTEESSLIKCMIRKM